MVTSNVSLMERNPKDSGVAVYFTWDGLSTCIAVDRYQRIEENLQAIHHVVEAERTKLRHGGLNLVRAAFRGYAALPPPSSPVTDPWVVLGVKRGASAPDIESAYRERAKKAHPDAGGGHDVAAQRGTGRSVEGGEAMTANRMVAALAFSALLASSAAFATAPERHQVLAVGNLNWDRDALKLSCPTKKADQSRTAYQLIDVDFHDCVIDLEANCMATVLRSRPPKIHFRCRDGRKP